MGAPMAVKKKTAKKKSAALKTTKTKASVADFIASVESDEVRRDAKKLVSLLRRVTGERPAMWGTSIVGFGQYHYVYPSGREGDWPLVGFSPRKRSLTLYVMPGFEKYQKELLRLGPHKLGRSCLYLDNLAGIDVGVLEEMLRDAVARMRAEYDTTEKS
jgi:hypothetical protein